MFIFFNSTFISMSKFNAKSFSIFIGILFLTMSIWQGNIVTVSEINTTTSNIPLKDEYTPISAAAHASVIIDANISSFTDKTGFGTPNEPYIIQNLEISSLIDYVGLHYAFLLKNTPEYVIIKNIVIKDIISSEADIRLFAIMNSDHVRVENLIIEDVVLTTFNNGYIFRCDDLENLVVDSLKIHNLTQDNVWGVTIVNSKDCTLSNIDLYDNYAVSWSSIEISDSQNITINNPHVTGIHSTIVFFGFSIFGPSIDSTFQNGLIENIEESCVVVLFIIDGGSASGRIQNCIFRDISATSMTTNYLSGEYQKIINNSFYNISMVNDLRILSLPNLMYSNITGNRIDNLYSSEGECIGIELFASSHHNKIFDNWLSNFISAGKDTSCITAAADTYNNRIWYNWFMTGTIVEEDFGTNIYSGPVYYQPLQILITMGNYWTDHAIDENFDFHYFVETPRVLYGNWNISDPLPIHYFMVDFDADGLNNFDENQYGTDIWVADTDGDGLNDGEDPYPTQAGDPSRNNIFDFFSEPLNILLLIVIGLLTANLISTILLKRSRNTNQPIISNTNTNQELDADRSKSKKKANK
jgi:hypothetical protein